MSLTRRILRRPSDSVRPASLLPADLSCQRHDGNHLANQDTLLALGIEHDLRLFLKIVC
jgi:hypothetical protein